MPTLIAFLLFFCNALPWVAIGLMAALALRKNKESMPLFLQAAGAAGMFLFAVAHWVIAGFLSWINVTGWPLAGTNYVFDFLLFVALATFATGYCMERFRRRKTDSAVTVSAQPID